MTIEKKPHFRVLEQPIQDTAKLLIIFTAMGTKIGLYRWFWKRFNRLGYSCIIYDYPMGNFYDSDPKAWEEFFDEIIGDARLRLKRCKQMGTQHFYAYGVSMGTLVANKFARETPEVSHVVLNLTYGDVASTVFTWWGIRKAKRALINHGYDVEGSRELFQFVDPVFNASTLKHKRVLLFLARRDKVLRWKFTQRTLQTFRDSKVSMEYVENKYLGHFLGGAKNMINIKFLDDFYRKG